MNSTAQDAAIKRWWRQHSPQDEWTPGFPLSGLKGYAEFARLLGRVLLEVTAGFPRR